jgi:magnesium-transporting ATPase (P-type)
VPGGHAALSATDLDGTLTLIGLIGLIDPPRAEAIAAVAECHAAGIRVKMITGDHAATARAIAEMIGLENHERVLTGADVEAMDDAASPMRWSRPTSSPAPRPPTSCASSPRCSPTG